VVGHEDDDGIVGVAALFEGLQDAAAAGVGEGEAGVKSLELLTMRRGVGETEIPAEPSASPIVAGMQNAFLKK
jgi:hypothetical protein